MASDDGEDEEFYAKFESTHTVRARQMNLTGSSNTVKKLGRDALLNAAVTRERTCAREWQLQRWCASFLCQDLARKRKDGNGFGSASDVSK